MPRHVGGGLPRRYVRVMGVGGWVGGWVTSEVLAFGVFHAPLAFLIESANFVSFPWVLRRCAILLCSALSVDPQHPSVGTAL